MPDVTTAKPPVGVGHMVLAVADVEASHRFYTALGLRVVGCVGGARRSVSTSKVVSCAGPAKPPAIPFASAGANVPSRDASQLALLSCSSTMVQPPSDGPAALKRLYPCDAADPVIGDDALAASKLALVRGAAGAITGLRCDRLVEMVRTEAVESCA